MTSVVGSSIEWDGAKGLKDYTISFNKLDEESLKYLREDSEYNLSLEGVIHANERNPKR